ncbi:MAG TPA: amidohydrolase family protein [Acidimicrobiia bacterium]|nr:amidohydrolase family protein [Acidimicrobiia bacterium]
MRTLFTNARIFDGTSAPISDGEVLVEDGVIREVGSGMDGDEVVDLVGRTILPGFFDCHVHVAFSDVNVWGAVQRPFSLHFYEAAHNLAATLTAGITTIRDAGGADLGMKEALERGLIAGPRMQISLTMLSRTGGHGDGWMPSGVALRLLDGYPGMPTPIVDGPEEMRRKVREVVRNGADVIKVATSGGVLSPRSEPLHPHFSPEELEVLVREATDVDRFVMAHAQAAEGIKRAVRAGIRSIEHGIYLDDEAIGLMLEHGTWLVPTLVAPTGVLRAAAAGLAITDAALRKANEVIDIHRHSFERAVEAGVRIAMGTDSGVTRHGENLDELQLMRDGGMAPHDVLVATTSSAAELLGVLGDSGTIEPGKRADLVVLDGDPHDFREMRDRIAAVYQDGELVSGGL